mgnify:CR=1 FL=1
MIPTESSKKREYLRKTSSFNQFDAYKNSARTKRNLNGYEEIEFNERLGDLYSLAIMENNLYLLSETQHKTIRRYMDQADGTLDEDLQQLDKYLGSL